MIKLEGDKVVDIEKKRAWFLITIIILVVLIFNIAYTIFGMFVNGRVSAHLPVFLFTLIPLVFVFFIIPNKFWRYCFSSMVIAVTLEFISRHLFSASERWAQALSVISLLSLGPALFFIFKFKKIERVQINSKSFGNPISLLIKLILGLALIFAIFYFSSR